MKKILSTIDIGRSTNSSSIEYWPLDHNKSLFPQLTRLMFKCKNYDVIFLNMPTNLEMLFCFVAKIIYSHRIKIVAIDLILRKPYDNKTKLISKAKSLLINSFDLILMFSQDTSGYEKYYKVKKDKFSYIPFKPNNLAMLDKVTKQDGDYIVSLGTSQRDYRLLIESLRPLKLKTKIVASSIGIIKNNANINDESLPSFIEHISYKTSALEWNELIAGSKFVVVPIIKETIQPAGVSVYLEAMALGKAVVVTRGASTNGVLSNDLAELVDEGDVEGLRSAVKELWYNDERRNLLEQNGHNYASSLKGHERLMDDIRNILDRV